MCVCVHLLAVVQMKVAGEGPFVVAVVPWGGTHMGGTVAREGRRVGGHRNHHGLGEAACRALESTLEMAEKETDAHISSYRILIMTTCVNVNK